MKKKIFAAILIIICFHKSFSKSFVSKIIPKKQDLVRHIKKAPLSIGLSIMPFSFYPLHMFFNPLKNSYPASFLLPLLSVAEINQALSNEIDNIFNIPTNLIKYAMRKNIPMPTPSEPVTVQTTTSLSQEEKLFLQNRQQVVQAALAKLNINEPLRVAFCFSGGGCRAMIGSLGLMQGAAQSGILNTALYAATLSGSTWFLSSWTYLSLQNIFSTDPNISLAEFQKNLELMLQRKTLTIDNKKAFANNLAKRFTFNQPLTLINLYGPLLGTFALKQASPNELNATWSSLAQPILSGKMPLPLCSAVYQKDFSSDLTIEPQKRYGWFEMSPLQAGGSEIGYIPVQYLGSEFKQGTLNNKEICPEYPLDYFMGIYGSAFAASLYDAYQKLAQLNYPDPTISVFGKEISLPIAKWIQSLNKFDQTMVQEKQSKVFAQLHNFSQSLESSVMKNYPTLGLVDGAFSINSPLALLFERPERNLDIIIMYDSGTGKNTLHQLANYFTYKNINIPDLSQVTTEEIRSQSMTIFNDPRANTYNSSQPTILYFPTLGIDATKKPYETFNFKYQPEDVDKLATIMRTAFTDNVPIIKQVYQATAYKKYPSMQPHPTTKPRQSFAKKANI